MKQSIIQSDSPKRCFICGRNGHLDVHHCLHGIRRKAADEYGLTVYLCAKCHHDLHDKGFHDLELERTAQEAFEQLYGHDKWMEVFGKNYR